MTAFHHDLFVIGGGSGGVAAARRAASYGVRVALCEEARLGGTCVLRGCVPKKLLVYGAQFREQFEDARGFGWTVGEARLDWGALIASKNSELDWLSGIYRDKLGGAGVAIFSGRARLVDANTVEVAGQRHVAKHVLVATGGRPSIPSDIGGVEHAITSDAALELRAVPGRVVIVGGGYIGVEFASILATAGSRVTLLCRQDMILRGFDDDVRKALTAELRGRGIRIECGHRVTEVERRLDGLSVVTAAGDAHGADVVLLATGREPNTRVMGLEAAGVVLDARGAIKVDCASSETAVRGVYAVGDCTDWMNLTPVAIAEGRAVADSLFGGRPRSVDYARVPTAVFSSPPVSAVGLTEGAARARLGALDVYVATFTPLKATLSGRKERVAMKLVVDRATQRVVGVHMVGPDAPEIIQGFAVALTCGATKAQFDATIGIHPSIAEEFVTMLERRAD